jgi:hypothetical protein
LGEIASVNCGYIIYSDAKYFPLAEVLIDSLLQFSKYPIEITTTGMDIEKKHARLTNKRADDILTDHFSEVCYFKNLKMATLSSFEVGVVLDADIVANKNVDDLMDLAIANRRCYTLHAGHGCDPNNQHETMWRLGVRKKSMPYVYSTYFFCNESKPFLKDCWDLSQKWKSENFIPPNTGEAVLNCMLWKEKVVEQVSCWLPYIDTLSYYLSEGRESNPLTGYYSRVHVSYNVFHGQKKADNAREIFTLLQKNDNNPMLNIKPRMVKI